MSTTSDLTTNGHLSEPHPLSLASHNPATGEILGHVEPSNAEQVRAAVHLARETATWWRHIGFAARRRHLRQWRRHIWNHHNELAHLIHAENGKPLDDAIVEIALTVEHIKWAESHAENALQSRTVSPGLLLANFAARVDHEPLGVVGVIAPWNYPVYAPNSATAYALAAGNTVVVKPSEHTPLSADWYVNAFTVANPDAPTGILTAVHGRGDTGSALCRSGVNKIAFTGSTATGRLVMAACAETLTPVVLECGGKDAAIVDSDADLPAAAEAIAWGGFTNAGQTCVGVERVYVIREVADRLSALLSAQLDRVQVGGADTTYGPMTMPAQLHTVRRHIDDAIARGTRVLHGTNIDRGDAFLEPVLLLDADEAAPIVREETFGPVITLRVVDSIDEAVRLANDSVYGLSASVFSRHHAEDIAARLDAGQVSLNSVVAFAGMGSVPMGGTKLSGFGRVHGLEGFAEFSRPRGVVRKRLPIPGFELIALHRQPHVIPLIKTLLSVRHNLF